VTEIELYGTMLTYGSDYNEESKLYKCSPQSVQAFMKASFYPDVAFR